MSKFRNVNLTPLGQGVILSPIFETESIVTESNIALEANYEKSKQIWKGLCEVVRVGDDVQTLKEGDQVYLNMQTKNKVAFEHKEFKLLWTVEMAVFARVNPESKIIL